MTRCRPLLLLSSSLLLLATGVASTGTAAGTAADEPRSRAASFGLWEGEYRHAGGPAEEQSLLELIDEMANGFNVILRPIARRRLEKTVVVPERIEIGATPSGLTVRAVGSPDLPDAPVFEEGAIVVRQSSFEGSRQTSFQLHEDGKTLVMHVTTTSALLPEVLDYQLTFERINADLAGGGEVPAPSGGPTTAVSATGPPTASPGSVPSGGGS